MESRQLLAGNVFASVAGGDLVLTGDNASNGVEVRDLGGGKYNVIGLVHDGVQTKVWLGGVGANSHVVAGVTDDFDINLNGGDDLLLMSNAGLPAGQRMLVPDQLLLNTHAGNDRVIMNNVQVRDDAVINLGDGHDYLSMFNNYIGGSAASTDNDLVVRGGAGDDFASLSNFFVRDDLFMSLEDGKDQVSIASSGIGDDAWIYTGLGDDHVKLAKTSVRDELLIDTGDGNDKAVLSGVTADGIYAQMGAGERDYLFVENTKADHARFDGGAGQGDDIDLGAGNVFGSLGVINFEL